MDNEVVSPSIVENDFLVEINLSSFLQRKRNKNKRSRTRRNLNKRGKFIFNLYFTLSTMALKASGWFIAKSARTFLFSSIPLDFTFPMN